jgi:hypothetical protein
MLTITSHGDAGSKKLKQGFASYKLVFLSLICQHHVVIAPLPSLYNKQLIITEWLTTPAFYIMPF